MSTIDDLERLTESGAAQKARQDRIRNARAAIARDEVALIQAREASDLPTAHTLTYDLANRRVHLAELLGHAPVVNWRGR